MIKKNESNIGPLINVQNKENENTLLSGQKIIINDYYLLKKSYSELRNEFLLYKKKYEIIDSEKKKLELELIKSIKDIKNLHKQIKVAKNIINEKEKEQKNLEEIQTIKNNNLIKIQNDNKNLNLHINELNTKIDELNNEKNKLSIELKENNK